MTSIMHRTSADLRGHQKPEEEREASKHLTGLLIKEVDRIKDATVDAVTDTRAITAIPVPTNGGSVNLPLNDRIVLSVKGPKGPVVLRLLAFAHDQLAEKTGIPRRYYDRMLDSAPGLLAENLNTWLTKEPEKRLLRMLKPMTEAEKKACAEVDAWGTVRAVLSDRFRPLDNAALLTTLLPIMRDYKAQIKEWSLDEHRFFVRIFTSDKALKEILGKDFDRWAKETGGARMATEMLRFGAAIRNSETGCSSLSVSPAVDVRSCTNTLVVTERLRIAHLRGGAKATLDAEGGDEEMYLQNDTRRLDQATIFLKVRDKIKHMFSPEVAKKSAEVIAEGAGTPLLVPAEVPMMEFVSNVGMGFDLSPEEMKVLREEYVHEVSERSVKRPNRFTISQAFTATAKSASSGHRKQELEEIGWRVLADPVTTLLKMGVKN